MVMAAETSSSAMEMFTERFGCESGRFCRVFLVAGAWIKRSAIAVIKREFLDPGLGYPFLPSASEEVVSIRAKRLSLRRFWVFVEYAEHGSDGNK